MTKIEISSLVVIFVLLTLIVGFTFGYTLGLKTGVEETIDIGLKFLEANDIVLNIDDESLKNGVLNYRRRISNCFN